jgi:AraC-like DNA-binding protein
VWSRIEPVLDAKEMVLDCTEVMASRVEPRADEPLRIDAMLVKLLSTRYIRMLFESEGTSITEFVREERLTRARLLLLSPRFAERRIAEIAYAVGFNDLSYFNRAFRRRFGRSPSEVREG